MKRAICKMEVTATVEVPTPWGPTDLTKEQVIHAAMGAVTQFHEVAHEVRIIERDEDGNITSNRTCWLKVWAEVNESDVEIIEGE